VSRSAKTVFVRVGEVDHEVTVAQDGSVTVDGEAYEVTHGPEGRVAVRRSGGVAQTLVTIAPPSRPGAHPNAAVVDGIVHALELMTAQEAALAALGGSGHAGGDGRTITSPMPGRIVRVMVKEGDVLAPDTPVVIVEAMKMENEVRAPKASRVVRVAVAAGATVDAGQVLLELEPHVPASA
jgi:biotin carboxyl carrier protein